MKIEKAILITVLIMIIIPLFLFVIYHEYVHFDIYRKYGVNSTMYIFDIYPRVEVVNNTENMDNYFYSVRELRFLQSQVEIIGHHTLIVVVAICFVGALMTLVYFYTSSVRKLRKIYEKNQ